VVRKLSASGSGSAERVLRFEDVWRGVRSDRSELGGFYLITTIGFVSVSAPVVSFK
jgi:hypothetical protein